MSTPYTHTRHVVVATDFSDSAKAAVNRADELSRRTDARMTVLHLVPPGLPTGAMTVAEATLRDQVGDAPARVTTAVEVGTGGAGIAAAAGRLHADLIVVGAHGEHWLRDLFVGSTALSVIDATDIPVLIVKTADPGPYGKVLVAVGSSGLTKRIAQVAAGWTPDARHVLAHAVTVVGENLLRLAGTGADDIARLREQQVAEARARIDAVAGDVMTRQQVESVVEPGRPEHLIPDLAGRVHADLVVVGTEKVSGLRHTIVGSVARHVIRHAACDVLIVHPSAQP